jgi:undecaprenyl diphosphate synthase
MVVKTDREMSYKDQIDLQKLPRHIAVIMDGNGRWAKGKGKLRVFGHHNGVLSVRDVVESAGDLGIEYLTLYTFSAENWSRPKFEVTAIMELLISTLNKEIAKLMKNNVRLNAIGDLNMLPGKCHQELKNAISKTAAKYRAGAYTGVKL